MSQKSGKKRKIYSMWKWVVMPAGTAATIYFSTKLLFKESIPKEDFVLRKPDFRNNVVYMVQFPVSPYIRSISPFALKLETYLRSGDTAIL